MRWLTSATIAAAAMATEAATDDRMSSGIAIAYRGRSDYGRPPQGNDQDDRGFLDRAGDEVRSWFGDEEAERRRQHGRSATRSAAAIAANASSDATMIAAARTASARLPQRQRSPCPLGQPDPSPDRRLSDLGVPLERGQRLEHPQPRPAERATRIHEPALSLVARPADGVVRPRLCRTIAARTRSRFESEFGTWPPEPRTAARCARQGTASIRKWSARMASHVGVGRQGEGRSDPPHQDRSRMPSGHHHSIPIAWIHDGRREGGDHQDRRSRRKARLARRARPRRAIRIRRATANRGDGPHTLEPELLRHLLI